MYEQFSIGLTPEHGSMRAKDAVGPYIDGLRAQREPEATINPQGQVMRKASPIGSRENPYQGEEVNVTAPAKEITGLHQKLIGSRVRSTGEEVFGENAGIEAEKKVPLQYGGSYGYGTPQKGYRSAERARVQGIEPIYEQSLTTAEGAEIPFGRSTMPNNVAIRQPGVGEGVREHGSYQDISKYNEATKEPSITNPQVKRPSDNTLIPKGQ